MRITMYFLAIAAFLIPALTASARPNARYVHIGTFSSSNPFNWDRDTVYSNYRGQSRAVIFEIDRGSEIEIRDIVVNCVRRPNCDSVRGGLLTDQRAVRVTFRRDLQVESITIRSRPNGVVIPPPKVSVYLETSRGNGGW